MVRGIMKKFFNTLFSICLVLVLFSGMSFSVSAAEDLSLGSTAESYQSSGSCGTGVTYALNSSTGVLVISGSGRMNDYLKSGTAPWYKDRLKVRAIIIGSGVTYIGEYAFKYCQAETVALSSSVSEIGMKAFIYTDCLKQVCYTGSQSQFKAIKIATGNSQFKTTPVSYMSSLTVAAVSPAVESAASTSTITYSFSGGVLTIRGSGSMKNYIADMSGRPAWVKYRSQATSIVIGSGVTSIGDYAFSDFTNVTSVTIPTTVAKIGYRAFYKNYALKSVTVPDSVTSIGKNAFQNCTGLVSVKLSGSLSEIPAYCFNKCAKLKSVTLSSYTTRIGSCAFDGCSVFETVNFRGTSGAYKNITISGGNTEFKNAKVSYI